MKTLILKFTAAVVFASMASAALAQSPPPTKGLLHLPDFATLADKASESVNVTLDAKLLGIACRFLNANDPEQADAMKICTSLRGVYVRSFKFEKDFGYPKADVDGVRRQLAAPGWSRIVEARSNKEQTNVDVFILLEQDKAMGLAIIASEPREFTIVNVVGKIDLADLHNLEGKFGVPELGIEVGKPAAVKPRSESSKPESRTP
jgi:hypothetical protein